MRLKCIRTLYKSTYKGSAFKKNKSYKVLCREDNRLYIEDKYEKDFAFCIKPEKYLYHIDTYFDPNPVDTRFVIIEKTQDPYRSVGLPVIKSGHHLPWKVEFY